MLNTVRYEPTVAKKTSRRPIIGVPVSSVRHDKPPASRVCTFLVLSTDAPAGSNGHPQPFSAAVLCFVIASSFAA